MRKSGYEIIFQTFDKDFASQCGIGEILTNWNDFDTYVNVKSFKHIKIIRETLLSKC